MDTRKDEITQEVAQDGQEERKETLASRMGLTEEQEEKVDKLVEGVFNQTYEKDFEHIDELFLHAIEEGFTKKELILIGHAIGCVNTKNRMQMQNPLAAILGG